MGYNLKTIDAHKKQIVQELFINTADDNYIAARWCFFEGLNVDFFWLAVHTLEKYMKAALLMNGRSGKSYRDNTGKSRSFSHDIEILYKHVKLLASDLLPNRLEQPNKFDVDYWLNEAPEDFLQRIYGNGNPDNRYQIFGFQQFRENIFKLDTMVFVLRRLCVPLDGYILDSEVTNLTYRDKLVKHLKEWKVSSTGKLEKTVDGKRGDLLRELLLNLNFPFAPADFAHSDLRMGMASRNPVLGRLILEPMQQASSSKDAALSVELCNWVLANIKVPKDVKSQLCSAKARWK